MKETVSSPKETNETIENPKVLKFSREESKILMDISRLYEREKTIKYVGDTNGLIRLLEDIVNNGPEIDPYRKKLGSIIEKVQSHIKRSVNWRYVPIDQTEPDKHGYIDNFVEHFGQSPRDPSEGTFIGRDVAEGYVRDNNGRSSFMLFAYNMSNLVPAPQKTEGGSNRRFIPKPNTSLEDSFESVLIFEFDNQVPSNEMLKERLSAEEDNFIEEALEEYDEMLVSLKERGVEYSISREELEKYLRKEIKVFISSIERIERAHVGRGVNYIDSSTFFKRVHDRATFAHIPNTEYNFRLTGNMNDPELLNTLEEAKNLPLTLQQRLLSRFERLIIDIVQEYNPEVVI
jgi:hypothetical protein